jgi:PKHD-type hydroxylase
MRGEWCYYRSLFSKEVCDFIVTESLKLPEVEATIGSKDISLSREHRRSKVRFINKDNEIFKPIFHELWNIALESNRCWFDFHLTKLDFIQFAEYNSEYLGEYKKHHDVFWLDQTNFHRKLSCTIQLSDPNDYEGGEFELYTSIKIDPEIVKSQGTAIIFPSFFEHQANVVTKGTRYSLTAWFEGPTWR